MKSSRPDPLETWVDRALREVPDEAAPAALTLRVMDELARRAALPWWRRNPANWPFALRVSVTVVPLLVAVLASPLPAAVATLQRQLDVVRVVAAALQHAAAALWQQVPSPWLSVALWVIACAVFAAFGAGLIARRLLAPAR
jgi:hypothetical protein